MSTTHSSTHAMGTSRHGWIVFLAGTVFALPFILTLALDHAISHDEHQHIAAGVLFARDGLLPYRDFPYFHLPYLIYAYGFIFQFTDHYLIATRIFSALCGALTCGVVAYTSWRFFALRPTWQRLCAAAGAMIVLMSASLFTGAVGRSWNQEPSVLLALLAFLCVHVVWQHARPGNRLFLSGLFLGLAIGMRVTMAPLVLPFAIMIWLDDNLASERVRRVLLFGCGIAVALIPVVGAFASSPAGFLFGIIEFPKTNIFYRFATGDPEMMTFLTKLRFFFKTVIVPNWLLFFGFPAAALMVLLNGGTAFRAWPRFFWFLLLTLPFLLMGAFAPSPVYDQYFYPLAPFLILGIASLLASLPAEFSGFRWMWGIAAVLVLTAPLFTGEAYDDLGSPIHKWRPSSRLSDVKELRHHLRTGRILTLAPTLPLEAGLQIYPEFSSGPFAWRIAAYIQPERRASLHLVGPDELKGRLAGDPPAAIITGIESKGEEPLIAYAQANGYRPIVFQKTLQLWLAPTVK